MVDLKPCPFCGNRLERSNALSTRGNDVFVHPVSDDDDLCVTQFVIGSSDGRRVAAWNRRADPRIAALEAQLAMKVMVKPLDDDQIMEIIKEVASWKNEPHLNSLLTYEKSPPMFPQATYDVPSYRATKLVRAVEARILSALEATPPARKEPESVRRARKAIFQDQDGLATPPAPKVTESPWATVQRGYDEWAAKPHNKKWVNHLAGTPIPNDLVVCIVSALTAALSGTDTPAPGSPK